MEKKDLIFRFVLIILLIAPFYFLGSSITGFVTQTMHCEDGGCNEYCRFNSDCFEGVCCDKGSFGVCGSSCEEYKFEEGFDMALLSLMILSVVAFIIRKK